MIVNAIALQSNYIRHCYYYTMMVCGGSIGLTKKLERAYKDYLISTFHTSDDVLNKEIEYEINEKY